MRLRRRGQDPQREGQAPDLVGPVSAAGIRAAFGESADYMERTLAAGGGTAEAVLCWLDGLVSGTAAAETLIRPLTDPARFAGVRSERAAIRRVLEGGVYAGTVRRRGALRDAVYDMLAGCCALVFPKTGAAVTFEMKSEERRAVTEPKEEKVVKGAKDAFAELIRTNTMLVRRRLADPALRLRETVVGSSSHTRVCVLYLQGFTNPELTETVCERLAAMQVRGLLSAAALESALSDRPRSPFPQLLHTERPDKFCQNLLEGRVGILADGLPMGFLAPGTFAQFFKMPEDRANHFLVASVLTLLRYAALLLSLLLPAFYTAVAMYHQEMLPTRLIQTMIEAKQSVPFPTAVEVMGMLAAFELLQEAGLRLPSPVGQTVSVIGALIVGQSAVEASVVSPVVVIVVALAGISGYTVPNQDMSGALRLCRLALVAAAVACGLFGIVIGTTLLLYHLCTLESCGVPYMTPFSGGKGAAAALLQMPPDREPEADPALRVRRKQP